MGGSGKRSVTISCSGMGIPASRAFSMAMAATYASSDSAAEGITTLPASSLSSDA